MVYNQEDEAIASNQSATTATSRPNELLEA